MSSQPAEYILPTNASEAERLNFQHKLLCRIFGGLFRAPLEKTKLRRILDIGCGTGKWAVDLAQKYPEAQIHGVDINESPEWQSAPSNCKFSVADVENAAAWESIGHDFDMIHGRFIVIAVRNWPALLTKCYDHLTPGGWIELQDMQFPMLCEDDIPTSASKGLTFMKPWMEGLQKIGLSPEIMNQIPDLMGQAGFVQPQAERFRQILGPWAEDEDGKELGLMAAANAKMGFRGFTERIFLGVLSWPKDKYEKALQGTLDELEEGTYRFYLPMKICIAQKPI